MNMKNEKEQGVIEDELINEVTDKRQKEAEEILDVLKKYPGSTCEELMMLSGFCGNCFSRRMAWLKVNKLIDFDGEYYWSIKGNKA